MLKKVAGIFIASIPLIFLFIACSVGLGVKEAIIIFGGTAVAVLLIGAGVWLAID